MRVKYLYVVEMLCWAEEKCRRWEPTVGVALWRNAGRTELREWQQRNPNDKFRLTAYRRLAKTV
jgi:hypothetical protein